MKAAPGGFPALEESNMIEELNNDYDLDSIEVPDPFAVGDTKAVWIYDRKWLVRWRDETTLMIAPDHAPDAWRPAHIYARGGCEPPDGFLSFVLVPDGRQEKAEKAIHSIDQAQDVIIDLYAGDMVDKASEGLVEAAHKALTSARAGFEALLGFKVPRPDELEPAE